MWGVLFHVYKGLNVTEEEFQATASEVFLIQQKAVLKGVMEVVEIIADLKAVGVLPEHLELRQVKYLNNLIEQDHRFIKRLTKPGMGFFSFETAWRTLQEFEIMT